MSQESLTDLPPLTPLEKASPLADPLRLLRQSHALTYEAVEGVVRNLSAGRKYYRQSVAALAKSAFESTDFAWNNAERQLLYRTLGEVLLPPELRGIIKPEISLPRSLYAKKTENVNDPVADWVANRPKIEEALKEVQPVHIQRFFSSLAHQAYASYFSNNLPGYPMPLRDSSKVYLAVIPEEMMGLHPLEKLKTQDARNKRADREIPIVRQFWFTAQAEYLASQGAQSDNSPMQRLMLWRVAKEEWLPRMVGHHPGVVARMLLGEPDNYRGDPPLSPRGGSAGSSPVLDAAVPDAAAYRLSIRQLEQWVRDERQKNNVRDHAVRQALPQLEQAESQPGLQESFARFFGNLSLTMPPARSTYYQHHDGHTYEFADPVAAFGALPRVPNLVLARLSLGELKDWHGAFQSLTCQPPAPVVSHALLELMQSTNHSTAVSALTPADYVALRRHLNVEQAYAGAASAIPYTSIHYIRSNLGPALIKNEQSEDQDVMKSWPLFAAVAQLRAQADTKNDHGNYLERLLVKMNWNQEPSQIPLLTDALQAWRLASPGEREIMLSRVNQPECMGSRAMERESLGSYVGVLRQTMPELMAGVDKVNQLVAAGDFEAVQRPASDLLTLAGQGNYRPDSARLNQIRNQVAAAPKVSVAQEIPAR